MTTAAADWELNGGSLPIHIIILKEGSASTAGCFRKEESIPKKAIKRKINRFWPREAKQPSSQTKYLSKDPWPKGPSFQYLIKTLSHIDGDDANL